VRRALDRWTRSFLDLMRLITGVDGVLSVMNSLLLFLTAWLSIMLWSRGGMTSGQVAAGLALVMRIIAMSGWVMQTVRGIFDVAPDGRFLLNPNVAERAEERDRKIFPTTLRFILNWGSQLKPAA